MLNCFYGRTSKALTTKSRSLEIPDKRAKRTEWEYSFSLRVSKTHLFIVPISSIDTCEHSMIKSKFKNSHLCIVYKFSFVPSCGILLLQTIFVYSNRIKDWQLVQKNLFLDMICKILQGIKTSSIKGALLDKEVSHRSLDATYRVICAFLYSSFKKHL